MSIGTRLKIRSDMNYTHEMNKRFEQRHYLYSNASLHNCFDFHHFLSLGVKVPITSPVYGYTKVLTHNLNSKKTSSAAIG